MTTLVKERAEIGERKSLNDIKKEVLRKREHFVSRDSVVYDATIENTFFKEIKDEIYQKIVEGEAD